MKLHTKLFLLTFFLLFITGGNSPAVDNAKTAIIEFVDLQDRSSNEESTVKKDKVKSSQIVEMETKIKKLSEALQHYSDKESVNSATLNDQIKLMKVYLNNNSNLKTLFIMTSINNIFIEWTSEVNNLLALTGYDPEYGARPIKREIRNVIEDKISELIINNKVEDGKTLFVDVVDNKIDISVG